MHYWTQEMDETLRTMAAEGKTSTWIGAAVGRSRNSVIGRAKRIGVNLLFRSPRGTGVVSPIVRIKVPAAKKRMAPPQPAAPVVPDEERVGIPLVELMSYSCRWPVHRDGEEARFCGAHAYSDFPYCLEHARRAYQGNWVSWFPARGEEDDA